MHDFVRVYFHFVTLSDDVVLRHRDGPRAIVSLENKGKTGPSLVKLAKTARNAGRRWFLKAQRIVIVGGQGFLMGSVRKFFPATSAAALVAACGVFWQSHVAALEVTCETIEFAPGASAIHASMDKACMTIVEREGKSYARLSAWVVAQTKWGTHVRLFYRNGGQSDAYKAQFPADVSVELAGRPVKLEDLAIRQEVDILVPRNYWSAPANASSQAEGNL
jgi:hypothetical protein